MKPTKSQALQRLFEAAADLELPCATAVRQSDPDHKTVAIKTSEAKASALLLALKVATRAGVSF